MRLLSISSSRAVWLFATNDLNPQGKHHPELMNAVRDRYKIEAMPTPAQILELQSKKQGLPIAVGSFDWSGGNAAIHATLFPDGITAETRAGTDAGDEFIADLVGWLHSEFGMTDSKDLTIRKIYNSEVYVHLSVALNAINPKLNKFADAVGHKASWPAPDLGFEVTGITISPNPAPRLQNPHPPFRLERDASAPFEDERYYSNGPLRTVDHLALLAKFEATMSIKSPSGRTRRS
jgi:hypothetical protein